MFKSDLINPYNYINGQFVAGDEYLSVYNKYTGELIGNIAIANQDQVEKALQSSDDSFKITKGFSAEKKASILENLYRLLQEQANDFAYLIAAEAGKPISYAYSEVHRALDNLKTGIRMTYEFDGQKIAMDYLNGKGKTAYTIRQAIGPVLGITPFNFPLNLALHKLIPAIAVGAPVILKPAPQAPLTLLAFAKLLDQAGLSEGAVNILFTTNKLSQKMVEDDRVKILSFTGSDKVGWFLKSISGKKKVILEMGGNAAAIVDETADLKRAAKKLAYGSFLNAGQICISTQRIYVVDKVYNDFLKHFLDETQQIKSGDPFNKAVVNSSMISKQDLLRIDAWIKEAITQGAKILSGGYILNEAANIYAPTIITNTNNQMKVWQEEAFAPIVLAEKVRDFKEAVNMVNDSRYGLQAGVFTNDLKNILYAQKFIETGGVIINESPGFRIDSMPYGGIKDSGLGREGAKFAMAEFTEPKLIVLND